MTPLVAAAAPPLRIRVVEPHRALADAALERLFRGERLTPARRAHLTRLIRFTVTCGEEVVGLIAYERVHTELRVHEFAVTHDSSCDRTEIARLLLDALDLACLAGGGRRIVLTSRAAAAGMVVQQRGYASSDEGCAGRWLEKTVAS